MKFSLSDDQVAFRDALHALLADTPGATTWRRLGDLGLFGVLVPDEAGGLGGTEVDAVPLLEEIGYAAVAEPVAATILAAALDPTLRDGATRVAVADEVVHYGQVADRLLVLEPETVRLTTVGERSALATVDPTVRAAHVAPDPGGASFEAAALTRDRLWLFTAAQLIGLGRRMLDLTTAYVSTRQQFGVPVGSFQAIKHHCANALLELEFAAPTVLAAAWAVAGRTAKTTAAVSLAVVLATEAASRTARLAIQCHGAMGYTVEYDLHRFAQRTWALAATIDIDEHLDRLARELELA